MNLHERLSQPYITSLPTEEVPKPPVEVLPFPPPKTSSSLVDEAATIASAKSTVTEETTIGSLRVWYGTWNLGGRRVNEPLEHWLLPEGSDLPLADLYVIAIQELVSGESKHHSCFSLLKLKVHFVLG